MEKQTRRKLAKKVYLIFDYVFDEEKGTKDLANTFTVCVNENRLIEEMMKPNFANEHKVVPLDTSLLYA